MEQEYIIITLPLWGVDVMTISYHSHDTHRIPVEGTVQKMSLLAKTVHTFVQNWPLTAEISRLLKCEFFVHCNMNECMTLDKQI